MSTVQWGRQSLPHIPTHKKQLVFFAGIFLCAIAAVAVWNIISRPVAHAAAADDFVTTWKTDNPGTSNSSSITIPTDNTTCGQATCAYNYDVDWNNDGTFDQFGVTGNVTHSFGAPGTYTIRIRGIFPAIRFAGAGDRQKIVTINQWGTGAWKTMENAFRDTTNLSSTATDAPNLSSATSIQSMFTNSGFNGVVAGWDTSPITDMGYVFQDATSFNQDISSWDTSNVTYMTAMFERATSFNQDISSWDVGKVTNMDYMFESATSFNQDISGWDTSKATNMERMFLQATSFSQDISSWDISKVTNMDSILNNTALSTATYDALLTAWSGQAVQPNINFSGAGLTYCDAGAARQSLIDLHGWNIDSNQAPECNVQILFLSPSVGGIDGSVKTITILGQGFTPDTTVRFGSQLLTVQYFNSTWLEVQVPTAGLTPHTVDVTVTNSRGYGAISPNAFTYKTVLPKQITGVTFGEHNGRAEMNITGTALVGADDPNEYAEALQRSLVSLNGTELPFCADGTGATAAYFKNIYPDSQVSDDPPCYYLVYDDGATVAITETSARIWLPNDFDTAAAGTVSVNGSPTFAFNSATPPGDHPPTFITNLAPNLAVTAQNGTGLAAGQDGTTNNQTYVQLKTSGGVLLAEILVDTTVDRDWSGVTAGIDIATKKAFVHGLLAAPGALNPTFSLYVPKDPADTAVIICPGASSLAAVTTECPSAVSYTSGDANVEIVVINGRQYWKVAGLTGTGGISIQQATTAALANTGASMVSTVLIVISLLVSALGILYLKR